PGSRPSEIARNLPKQLEATLLLWRQYPEIQVAICTAEAVTPPQDLPFQIHCVPFTDRYALMKATTLALAKSGTVTLELAIHAVPTVVIYQLSLLNRLIAGYIYKLNLPFYCIVNILTQKELFAELIRPPVSAEAIMQHLKERYTNKELRASCQQGCQLLTQRLQTEAPPTKRAVEEICALLQNT
ncbi:MAG: lipid-A-disaccharide synthase, partial [Verrucomicrobia bacterium]|nr:lipid-A-disaccharide synthase [Verrucomicrobiota bacterium]